MPAQTQALAQAQANAATIGRATAIADGHAKLRNLQLSWRDQLMKMPRVEYQVRMAELSPAVMGVELDAGNVFKET
ncbi:hypothetical protein FDECE_16012 [Fusarium decemcellulare]|nr:hypothetical protein FDECE_16012 [Fusarium decemcellulare]